MHTVYVVDDDSAVRKSLARSLTHHGYLVEEYESGNDFLDNFSQVHPSCLVLDIAMPGMSGLEVQAALGERNQEIPIIFVTGHGDIPTSVHAIKSGAIEFLEKPYATDTLLDRLKEALAKDEATQHQVKLKQHTLQLFETLTQRERQVMAELVAGVATQSNKEIARKLKISHRTVDEYRARVMSKMDAASITHLVELAKICNIHSA
ncbi:MAG: response regulator [Acidiferrobacterales bacterium]|nr:response regulator [Acidiferrobacterales bacterium]